MNTIQFHAVVGQEQVIRPPDGVTLPQGEIEVTVRPRPMTESTSNSLSRTRDWLLGLAAEAEQERPHLPSDLAEQHDHYAHGKPLP